MKKVFLILLCFTTCQIDLFCQGLISLNDYGWRSAKNGVERAKVLYEAQSAAIKKGTAVDYSGIKVIDLEITSDFKSIPLSGKDDFLGVVFNVKNNAKDVFLFTLLQRPKHIEIPRKLLDGKSFGSIPELRYGEYLLIVEDKQPWVDNRVGYDYGHTRKDILSIKDGRSVNTVVSSYNNMESSPDCLFFPVTQGNRFIKSFVLNRVSGSQYKTRCMDIRGQGHLLIENVTIKTPKSNLTGDYAIRIQDCADIVLKDIVIDGTYSSSSKYGYGININNTWNTRMVNLKGHGEWGVMGNNNMSDTYLYNCEINRFDIHCYGRNVFLSDCIIDGGEKGWYCGGSSIYGTIQYDRCQFSNCIPISYGNSYKTAVGADVIFNDCIFKVTKKRNAVFSSSVLEAASNPRRGLSRKDFPNIEINRMKIIVPKGVNEVFLYDVGSKLRNVDHVGYMRKITIHDLEIETENVSSEVVFRVFSTPINTLNALSIDIQGLNAPNVTVNPEASINKRNKVRIRGSRLKSVKEGFSNTRIKVRNSKIEL